MLIITMGVHRWSWLLLLCLVAMAQGEEVPTPDPRPLSGATGGMTVRLELMGKGLVPTARVLISNSGPLPLHLRRSWTYELIPQATILDRNVVEHLPAASDDRSFSLAEIASLPEARIHLTLAPRKIFTGHDDDEAFTVGVGKAWGHDHLLDLRPARLAPGIIFVRLTFGSGAQLVASDWVRYRLPEVPDLPLVRFTEDARKLGDPQFARLAKQASVVFTATAASGDFPFTRVLTLAENDPLAATFPRLLLDGKSTHVLRDGVPCRFAVVGIADGRVEDDARVLGIQLVE